MARKIERFAEAIRYVLKADRGLAPEQQTTFVLEALKGSERMLVWDNLNRTRAGTGEMISRSFQQARELLLNHIISIENYPVGSPQPWPKDPAKREEYLEQFDDLDLYEVGNELRERSSIGKTPEPTMDAVTGEKIPATDVDEEAKHAGN